MNCTYLGAKTIIEEALPKYLADKSEVLGEELTYATADGGKRVRPVMMILCAEALGVEIAGVLPYAVALELIHSYSLVHDDLPEMDGDMMRRGKPSVHAKFGVGRALLTGDMLLSVALDVCAYGNVPKAAQRLTKAAMDMVEGQTLELELTEKSEFSEESIMKVYSLKTAALFKSALMVPYEIAVADNKVLPFGVNEFEEISEKIGIIFQIVDDFLDLDSGKDAGKPTLINNCGKEKACEKLGRLDAEVNDFFVRYKLEKTALADFVFGLTMRKA